MEQLNTKYKLENTMCCAIAEWFTTRHIPLYKYPEKLHDSIWSQGTIGWRHIFNKRISQHWLKHQGNTKTSSRKVRMDYIWEALIVETYLCIIMDFQELRNEEVHGKEEVTKQQKRKDKAATSVRALHGLEEIA